MEAARRELIARRDERIVAFIGAALCLGAVLVPALLTPDARGFGTHQQLMVSGCGFQRLTGLPCPLCGMTTAFAHLARGEIAEAFAAHPAGPPLQAALLFGGLYGLVWGATGHNPLRGTVGRLSRPRAILWLLLALWIPALLAHFARR